jgi:hypothetical protein
MYEEPLPLRLTPFRVHSEDPAFHVEWRGGSRFALSGEVALDPSAELDVSTPTEDVEIFLATHSTPSHAVAADGVEVVFTEALVPAARTPRFRTFCTDAQLRTRQLDENKLEFLGGVASKCLLTILCDTRRVTIDLDAGTPALAVAARVGANVPHGFRALVDGPVVSVWKDAEFFSAVA